MRSAMTEALPVSSITGDGFPGGLPVLIHNIQVFQFYLSNPELLFQFQKPLSVKKLLQRFRKLRIGIE